MSKNLLPLIYLLSALYFGAVGIVNYWWIFIAAIPFAWLSGYFFAESRKT